MPTLEKIAGRVARVRFASQNGKCTIGNIRLEPRPQGLGDPEPTFKFFGAVSKGDEVTMIGTWEEDPKWGRQFIARNVTWDIPVNTDGLIRYLADCEDFKGLGYAKAAKLVNNLPGLVAGGSAPMGDQDFAIVQAAPDFSTIMPHATPEQIAQASGLSLEDAQAFAAKWNKRANVNALATQLAAWDLTANQIERIAEALGGEALAIIKNNPYALIGQVDGFGFSTVDKIALRIGVQKNDERRLHAGIRFCLLEAMGDGDTWLPLGELVEAANKILVMDQLDSRDVIAMQIGALEEKRELEVQSVEGRGRVSLLWVREAEQRIGTRLFEMGQGTNSMFFHTTAGEEVIDDFVKLQQHSEGLNEDQLEALRVAMTARACIITGPAGTGKTTVVKRILEAYASKGISVCLTAPTGKAAKRLQEVVGVEAFTLHRLMGYNGRNFQVVDVPYTVVIVDEVSMVDVLIMAALVDRLRTNSILILVGDHNQLPPVGPGNVLRDALAKKICPIVTLTQVVRQAGPLRENAMAVLDGEVRPMDKDLPAPNPWIVCDKIRDQEHAHEYIVQLFEKHIDRLGYDLLFDVQLLTAQREGPLGINALNIALQRVYQARRGVEVTRVEEGKKAAVLEGDRVINTRNNYDLGIMNGDVGIVRGVSPKYVRVGFGASRLSEGKEIEIPSTTAGHDLSLAYALTVHRSQGSEYPCVVLVVHKAHSYMHRSGGRNWLYTGATRAKKTLILVGDHWGMRNAADKTSTDKRRTWLSLWTPPQADLPQLEVIASRALPALP